MEKYDCYFMNYKKYLKLFNLVILLLFIQSNSVIAQNGYYETTVTPEEQAIFAFFRAAEEAPDYDLWIKSKSKYKNLPESKKEGFLIKEIMRLGQGYGAFDIDTDLIEIKINTVSKYIPAKDGKPARITFRFLNLGNNEIPTFNYKFGDGYISMIINKFAFFSNLKLSPEKDKVIRDKIPYEDDEFDTELEVHLKISSADYKNFKIVRDKRQWFMIGEIAYIKCSVDSYYTQQNYILWDYVAPWYEQAFRIKNMPEEEKYPHPYDLFKDR